MRTLRIPRTNCYEELQCPVYPVTSGTTLYTFVASYTFGSMSRSMASVEKNLQHVLIIFDG